MILFLRFRPGDLKKKNIYLKYSFKKRASIFVLGFVVFRDASTTDCAEGDLDSKRTGQENPPKIEFTPISNTRPLFVMAFNKKEKRNLSQKNINQSPETHLIYVLIFSFYFSEPLC